MTAPRTLLLDADGVLFGSEEPAFEASARVVNRLLERLGDPRRLGAEELRRAAVGRNFRATAGDLAREAGVDLGDELEDWVRAERDEVVAHLRAVLRPDPRVGRTLRALAGRHELAVVSSSALARLDACFRATGLYGLLPPAVRFSAEDSLPVPTSKPDPAVYAHAGAVLGVSGPRAVAVEDAPAGVRSAAGAGFPVVGLLHFVPREEREERAAALRDAGARAVAGTWDEVPRLVRV